MAMDRVLAEDERRRNLAVRQPGCDETQHLGLAPAERRCAVRRGRRGVVEEAGERALEVALVVEPRQVRIAAQRHEPRVREQRRELAAMTDRHRPVAATVENQRRHRDAREVRPRVGRQLELEERCGGLGVRSTPEMAPDRGNLVAARMRDEEP